MLIHKDLYIKLIDIFTPIITMLLLSAFMEKVDINLCSIAILSGMSLFAYSFFFEHYHDYYFTHMDAKLKISVTSWIFSIIVIFIYLYFINPIVSNTLVLFSWILITPVIILLVKFYLKKMMIKNDKYIHRIIIIGNEYKLTTIEHDMLISKGYQISFIKDVIEFNKICTSLPGIDRIVINADNFDTDSLENSIRYNNKIISMCSFLELYQRKLSINKKNIESILSIKAYPKKIYLFKRLCDYTFPIIFFIPIIVIMLFSYAIQKLQSPGKFFYLQKRVGKNKIKFDVLKIRTMHEKTSHDPYTRENDKRIYPFGNKLRIHRLDEIPQIINVIKGDMHLIGPRAEWDILADDYEKKIKHYDIRSIVKPGITGWAQVMFRYGSNIEDSKQKLMYDLYYIKNWSVWLELEIGIRTFMVIFKKGGL